MIGPSRQGQDRGASFLQSKEVEVHVKDLVLFFLSHVKSVMMSLQAYLSVVKERNLNLDAMVMGVFCLLMY